MPVINSINQNRRKWKIKVTEKRKMTQAMLKQINTDNLDAVAGLIQALIPIGLDAVKEKLLAEVSNLVGERYSHGKVNTSWGSNPGSVYLQDQKVPVTVPRVRNKTHNIEVPLQLYQKLQSPYLSDRQTMLKLLNGISTHKYAECTELVPEVFGLSSSNLSRRFKQTTKTALRRLKTRSLSGYDFICIFIDGKRYSQEGLIIALGVTTLGEKVILGIEQSFSENSNAIYQLLDNLIDRGLKFEEGLLFIVDGSKGIIAAVTNRFKEYAFIQRCLYHKQENVTSYLNKRGARLLKRRLKDAYSETTHKEAKAALDNLHNELLLVNQSAAGSLKEGLEETLTLHKLGLSTELYRSLNSTNCIESVMSQIGQYTDKVDYWQNSEQLLRWNAACLLEIEPRLNKIQGTQYLRLLRLKMKEEIRKRKQKKYGYINKESPKLEAVEV